MIAGGLIVGTVALVVFASNLGKIKHTVGEWHDNCLLLIDDDPDGEPPVHVDQPGNYQQVAEILRRAKRREHLAGVAPGSLTPMPYRSIFYGPNRQGLLRDQPEASDADHNFSSTPQGLPK